MAGKNYKKMMEVIDSVFATRTDPDQLQVDQKQLKKLEEIHPSTLSEVSNDEGPLIWALMIPTKNEIMKDFLSGKISEKQILEKTQIGDTYDALYLCSVTTLPEFRNKGETKTVCLNAIQSIRKDHTIKDLFVWSFTNEGDHLAENIAKTIELPLLKRTK